LSRVLVDLLLVSEFESRLETLRWLHRPRVGGELGVACGVFVENILYRLGVYSKLRVPFSWA